MFDIEFIQHSSYYVNDNFNILAHKKGTRCSILSSNIQSMHAKFNELELNQIQFSFSVICIHECWLEENYEMSQLTLTNYNYTATGRRYSNKAGLLICAHNNTITQS